LSPLDYHEFAFGCADPLGLISFITWEQSSLKCIREDMNLSEALEGEEGATMAFPLLRASFFNLLLAWEDFTAKWSGVSWEMGLTGRGVGKHNLGQP
jgi:hypothetical protein